MGWWDDIAAQLGKVPSANPATADPNEFQTRNTFTPRMANEPGQAANYPSPQGGGDFQQQFMGIMGGGMATPDALIAKEAELAKLGIKVLRNASGVAGKVQLPSGEIVDVIQSAGTGGGVAPWQWNQGPGGPTGEGGRPLPGNTLGSLGGASGGVDYTKRQGALEDTPGFKFRFDQGVKAIQDSAAARGTLLTGGVLKDLATFGQGLASTEYQNEWDRTKGLAEMGFNAASNQGYYGSQYGTQLTNLTTGAGNAQAAGTAAAGNIWGGALNNIGQGALDAWGLYKYGPRQPQNGGGARY